MEIKQFTKNNRDFKHVVSYNQFNMWSVCPYRWYLTYPMRHGKYEPNINLLFGNSMHETIQFYVKMMYTHGVKRADSFNLNDVLYYRMIENFKKFTEELRKMVAKEKTLLEFNVDAKDIHKFDADMKKKFYNRMDEINKTITDNVNITQSELDEYYKDGIGILTWFKKNRSDYFNSRNYELVGVEIPVELYLKTGIKFNGFLDIVLKEKTSNDVVIIDLKTSKHTWNKWQKSDSDKMAQLVLYKIFYSKLYHIPLEKIKVQFIILKRKLFENCDYPQKRFQKIVPASGKPTINKIDNRLNEFLSTCFNDDGDYNYDGFYPKIATENNCRFCTFSKDKRLCSRGEF